MKIKQLIPALCVSLGIVYACTAQETAPADAATSSVETETAPVVEPASSMEAVAAPAAADSPAAEPSAAGGVIPLIQFVEAPITAVIENLARQAGINYILDPKLSYGQPGPDGKIIPQPSISIRWENLTAQQALSVLLSTYDLLMIEDPRTKIIRIAPKDPAAPDPLVNHVIQLKFADPTVIQPAVQSALTDKRSKVLPDVRTSQLVVVATEKEMVAVDQLVERLDTMTKQVLIEAKLIETSLSPKSVKGVDWTGTLQAQNIAFGNNLQNEPVPAESLNAPLATKWPKLMVDTAKGFNPATAFLDADGVSAVLSFLNTDSDAKVLSTPRAVTLDNETAHLAVTTARPIFKTTAGTQGSPGGAEVTYTNLGTILQVTPRISANNYVNLKVVPEVSSFVETITKTVSDEIQQADVFAFRKIDTHVLIPSGNTLVLGGLIGDSSTKGYSKVPVLGDVPLVGLAFRHESKERQQKNLMIFITPTIIQESDFQPTQTDFLKTRPPEIDEKPWSAWDSGKPAIDWTKLSGGTKSK